MRYVIMLILWVLPLVGYSQSDGNKIMDVNNIDYRLLDSLIVVEVNKVRDSLGNYKMNYSRVVSDSVSKRTCDIMSKEQHVYHPDGRENLFTDKLESSIIKESSNVYGNNGGEDVNDSFEICLFMMKTYKQTTYGVIAKEIVDLWESSPDHCFVVRDAYNKKITKNNYEIFLMSGVSTKYGFWNGRYGFYAVLNLFIVYNLKS